MDEDEELETTLKEVILDIKGLNRAYRYFRDVTEDIVRTIGLDILSHAIHEADQEKQTLQLKRKNK